MMKAVIFTDYGTPDVLEMKDVAKPVPKDKEVLVKIHATTVTSGDARIRALDVPFGFKLITRLVFGIMRPRKPILGFEYAGIISEIGADVTKFKIGDEVFGSADDFGCNAEYVAVKQEGAIALKPQNMSFEEAAAVTFGGLTSLYFLRDIGKIKQGDKILIYGASGCLGTYAVQIAKYCGAEVTAVCSGKNAELVKSLGADHVVDYRVEDYSKNGKTYDIIFDTVGKSSFAQGKNSLTEKGRFLMAVAGLPQYLKALWILISSSKKLQVGLAIPSKKDVEFIKDLIEEGKIKSTIDKIYPLEETALAHRYVDTGRKKGSVVIKVVETA